MSRACQGEEEEEEEEEEDVKEVLLPLTISPQSSQPCARPSTMRPRSCQACCNRALRRA